MLRERHIELLEKIVGGDKFEWSVLVLDTVGQDIVAPLFRLSELMEIGVVQCLKIGDPREKIEEARAVYLVEETKENTDIVKEDVSHGKYREVDIVFTGTLSRGLFEDLAVSIGRKGESRRVSRVMDGLLRLSVLHSSLYTLNLKNTFGSTSPRVTSVIETGLVSLIREIDTPVLFAGKEHAHISEEVARRVQSLGLSKAKRSAKRSAVVILGREMDLLTPVEHGWTYSSLINDILEYDLNKVTIPESVAKVESAGAGVVGGETGSTAREVFDLNRFDAFWDRNQNEYFPAVAERVEQELGEYKAELAQRSIKANSSKEVISGALSKAPELAQKNKAIHTHMTISLSLVEEIKKQKIDEIFSIENDTNKISDVKDEIEDLLPKVTAEHFLRMCAVLIQRFPHEREYLEGVAKKKGCSLEVLRFLTQGGEEFEGSRSMVAGAASSLFRNIKRMLPIKKKLPVTTAVEEVLGGRSSLACIDVFGTGQAQKFSSVHVFVVGGGTFAEYKALTELAEGLGIEITYGSTEILSPAQFISQVESLSKKGKKGKE
ncbi:sec1 family domain-containing protein 1 [Nematocida sp. AWRm77]|nr:sec1 family domain-containing protein 1 [Nematocida sp. AWRm77]